MKSSLLVLVLSALLLLASTQCVEAQTLFTQPYIVPGTSEDPDVTATAASGGGGAGVGSAQLCSLSSIIASQTGGPPRPIGPITCNPPSPTGSGSSTTSTAAATSSTGSSSGGGAGGSTMPTSSAMASTAAMTTTMPSSPSMTASVMPSAPATGQSNAASVKTKPSRSFGATGLVLLFTTFALLVGLTWFLDELLVLLV
ncbi:uncharacterized protein PFL1_04846 [Pseudozyma flocculosa PF-1]|uniref:Uncharacterized protein n=2 Tax=Pseudozyma flocculosa TaxID=84751 RepID=A0A5C3F7B3_9BASI|nr:uncharacterized protein PFL1_04846 [Pseudozyma flocculosa PF-1]EPQ27708.1 hypothetical protein PFL1_04846 [Pseudozyma flocculosa PF-1]SPO39151.1 uncharacterized protein PSFLO_04630 [Pseudozyma flocculosa]